MNTKHIAFIALALAFVSSVVLATAVQHPVRSAAGVESVPQASWTGSDGGSGYFIRPDAGMVFHAGSGTESVVGTIATYYGTVKDEGSSLTQRQAINFTGAGVVCTDNSGSSRTDCTVSGVGVGNYQTVQSNAVDVSQRSKLNFSPLFTLSDSSSPSRTTATLADTAVGAGTCTSCDLTIDAQGRVTAKASGSGGSSTGNYSFSANTMDLSGAATMSIAPTTATAITLGQNVTISGSKTLTTGTGTATMNGAISLASGVDVTAVGGASDFDFSAASGIFKATTGAGTFGGASNAFTNGAGVDASHQNAFPAVSGSTYAVLDAQQDFTKDQGSQDVALTDASTVAVDCTLGNTFTLLLTGSGHTIGNPTGCKGGHTYQFLVKQAAGGSDTLLWDTKYLYSGGTAPTQTATADKTDIYSCVYLDSPDKMYCVWVGNF